MSQDDIVLRALNTARDEVTAMQANMQAKKDQAILASVHVLFNHLPNFERAITEYEKMRFSEAVLDMCDQGHRYLKLADHPMRDGRPRCPHCLAIGFDNFRKEIEERMKEDERTEEVRGTSQPTTQVHWPAA